MVQMPWGRRISEAARKSKVAKVVTGRDESIQSTAIGFIPRKNGFLLTYFLLFYQVITYYSYYSYFYSPFGLIANLRSSYLEYPLHPTLCNLSAVSIPTPSGTLIERLPPKVWVYYA